MPYVSTKQRGLFHAKEERGEISPAVVNEFDKASKGKKLPTYAHGKPLAKKTGVLAKAK
jgi:hypothetical protein